MPPEEGLFSRYYREFKAAATVDKEVIEAIKEARIEVVAAVESLDHAACGWRTEGGSSRTRSSLPPATAAGWSRSSDISASSTSAVSRASTAAPQPRQD